MEGGSENGGSECAHQEKGPDTLSTGEPKKAPLSVSTIQVNPCQRGNPILKEIRNVPWEFVEGIVPDYILGSHCVALFLSLRYFNLHPDYIHDRLKALGSGTKLRVLLVLIDQKDPHHALNKLMRICILSELTLMLAWNNLEAGKILETYKLYENKPPDMIMEKAGTHVHEKIIEALTTVKSVSKTDATTLLGVFGSLENILEASIDDLSSCPGFGPHKASRLHKVLTENFKRL
eukprot:TRINITY_DN1766_c0_g1_i4.p1 TRINITY_DN1766_c0_g1~~TRINITY_DN1766_c0_g1_i4.p1  ORF type:complete len:234 (-),score=46.58 TRINITY_DN1766_c0_g1_i4:58-759(-)